eukprot:INCI19173.1.p1 GENE.INCI19173.1~~INCI19173.1.p1  ORF type:complete len:135 (-),score=5.25 INCI19173.1:192-596(-)
MKKIPDPAVRAAYAAFPEPQRSMALGLRALVLEVAAETPQAGALTEALKWGQPSFLTAETKSGTTLRIGLTKAGEVGMFAHCATTVVSDYASRFPGLDRIDGKRGVLFASGVDIVPERLRVLIRHGLTYHLRDE